METASTVNLNDMICMHQGCLVKPLTKNDLKLLRPINISNKNYKKALLLIHGFSSSPAVFRHYIPHLIKHYDAIICPVLPGHAQSITAFSKVTRNDWLQFISKECQILIKKYQTVDVMGLSLGGILACHLAQQFNLNHLYLLAPALALHSSLSWNLFLARSFSTLGFKELFNLAGNIYHSNECEWAYRRLPLSIIIEILQLIKETSWWPITCPVHLFLGKHDMVVNSTKIRDFFISKPNINVVMLPNSAHIIPLDQDRDRVIEIIS